MESGRIFGKGLIVIGIVIVLLIVTTIFLLFLTPGSVSKTDNNVHIVYFYSPSCGNCTKTNNEIERINRTYPGRLEVDKIDITPPMGSDQYQIYTYFIKTFDLRPGSIPVVIVNETICLVGSDSIVPNLEGIINGSIVVDQ